MNHIPANFQPALWSYDISQIDKVRDANLVITQLLNYGGREGEEWVLANYPKEKIRQVLVHPQRGVWLRETLRKWLNYFDLMIDPLDFEAAIRNLMSPISLVEEVWKRKVPNLDEFLHPSS